MTEKLLQQALDALMNSSSFIFIDVSKGHLRQEAIGALQAAIAQPAVTPEPPHGWVLIPNEPATPTPDYAECARQATLATGLPSHYRGAWLNIFIREINRWCQHAATPAAAQSLHLEYDKEVT